MKFSLNKLVREKRKRYGTVRRSLIGAIKKSDKAIITEIKKKSPSKGRLRDMDVAKVVKSMEGSGACAISVLTDEEYFNGCLDDLRTVRENVDIPVLRKDFIVDEFQLYESLVFGADAVLLIATILKNRTRQFVEKAHKLGLETLVEVHDIKDVKFALETRSKLIGINNRDLKTLKIDLGTTERLISQIPKSRLVVSESGVRDAKDVERLFGYGADAILVGTALMKSCDVGRTIKDFVK